jgi:N-methylhydantoinase A
MTRLINIDNGGTLTDICVVDGEHVHYTKTLTTPFDLSRCLFDGLSKASGLLYGQEQLPALLQSTDYIRYSTTQATNALVQRKGPRLGLLTTDATLIEALSATRQEEDLLAELVGDRHSVIDVAATDDALACELVERVNGLAGGGASRLVVAIGGEQGAAQEMRVKSQLLRLYPRQLSGAIPLLFSWELVADRDDVRRTWSALLSAFLQPAMERFLSDTEERLRESRARRPLLIFRNDGGSSRASKSAALKTYNSGPRGGLEGARALAGRYGFRHLLMVDVGGTTTDVGVVSDGEVEVERRGRVAMVPTSFELAAVTSHGVGGSSVIRVTDGNLGVGPDSVGAAPGPACFGLGGADATITDVYLCMGLLDAHTYLDGTMALDVERSRKAVQTAVAEPLGLSMDQALLQMEAAYLDRVADALRAEPLTWDTVIAAFGGAGPMTVCGAAERAGVRKVIIPRTAAVFSAFGIGFSDISQNYEALLPSLDAVAEVTEQLRRRARRDMSAEGVDLDDCVETVRVRVTRGEQEFVIDPHDKLQPGDAASLELSLVSPLPHVAVGGDAEAAGSQAVATGRRGVVGGTGDWAELAVYSLRDQSAGAHARGPAVIEGPFFTMRLPSGWRFDTTAAGDLLLTDDENS